MTVVDGFYDSSGGDRVYDTQNFSDFFALQHTDGVIFGLLNSMQVTQAGVPDMSVDVSTGGAYVQGRFIKVTATENLAIAASDPTNPRIDRIVIRADESAGVRTTSLEVLTGTPAGSPTAPSLTQTSTIWELSLAQIAVAAATTQIITANITDERFTRSLCGPSEPRRTFKLPAVRLTKSANQSIPDNTETDLIWQTETFDTENMHGTNSAEIILPFSGLYLICASILWTVNVTGTRIMNIVQGANNIMSARQIGADSDRNSASTVALGARGDIIKLRVFQDSGTALDVETNNITNFGVTYIGHIGT